jgi:hypothetical protein
MGVTGMRIVETTRLMVRIPVGLNLTVAVEGEPGVPNGEGFTPDEAKQIEKELARLKKTKKGRQIIEALEKDSKDHKIKKCPATGERRNPCQRGIDIYIRLDADYGVEYNQGPGFDKWDLWRMIIHELNHLLGAKDDGPTECNNIEDSENAVAAEMGERRRISYVWMMWDPVLKKWVRVPAK